MFDISTNGCQVSQRFVNSIDCHVIRVDLAIERVDAICQDDTSNGSPYILDGLKHCCIARAVACSSYQWFKNGSALYFMVVATHDRLFGGDGRMAEEREKRITHSTSAYCWYYG